MVVERTELAPDSRLRMNVMDGDFLDCYSVSLSDRADVSIGEIAQRIFIGLPCWIRTLLAVRDAAIIPFGLKATASLPTDNTIRPSIKPGDAISFLRVRSIDDNEIVLGEDDRHLDFKIAVRRDPQQPNRISLATWVHTHNRLGDAYLRMISRFHVMIVRSRLTALARHFAV